MSIYIGNKKVAGLGSSAYEVWLENGNTGTEEDFLESLKGGLEFPTVQKEEVDMTDRVLIKTPNETEPKYLTIEQIKGSLNEEILLTLASNQPNDTGLLGSVINTSYPENNSEDKT